MNRLVSILSILCLAASLAGNALAQNTENSEASTRAADLEAEISYRIIGGLPAAENAWPWQVALFMRSGDGSFHFHCGGSIIDRNWVLTAAHCIGSANAQDYVVVEGTTRLESDLAQNRTGRRLNVAQVIANEGYDPKITRNDIALLRLATPANSKPVLLDFPENNSLEKPGTMTTVTGWGLIKPFDTKWEDFETHEKVHAGDPRYFTNRLMEVSIPLVDCQKVPWKDIIDHRQVCAGLEEGGKDSCRGDSGGPLVARDSGGAYEQIGIVSFGALKCANKDAYGVYSKVSAFESWIRAKSGLSFNKPAKPVAPPPVKPPPAPKPPTNPAVDNKAGLSIGFVQGDTLRPGQSVQFKVTTQAPGYLVLFDCTPDGKAIQIYPNRRSLAASKLSRSNRLEPNRQLVIPDPNNPYEGFEFKVDPPFGPGVLLAILSSKPLTSVNLTDVPKQMETAETLEYMANIVDELKRDLSISSDASAQDWSFVTKPYRVVP
jgi:secreted trypsin-like serine protease